MTSSPIVVTGSHRSGTTWTGRMLSASGEAGYVHEPFNPVRRPNWSRRPVPYWYVYIAEHNEADYASLVDDLLRFRYPVRSNLGALRSPRSAAAFATEASGSLRLRRRAERALLKDPFALFSSEWLARRYGASIVIMIRHPAAFVGSIKRLNWQFKFKTVLAQDQLIRDWLHPFEAEMRRCRDQDVDVIDQGIVLWKVLHFFIDQMRERHPDWAFVRHEDLAGDPVTGFESLYRRCGLTWGPRAELAVREHSTGGNKKDVPTWRHGSVKRNSRATAGTWSHRLTTEEVGRIRRGVEEVASRFYSEDAWVVATSRS